MSAASPEDECRAGAGETTVSVDGKANIFGAGKPSPPAPGGGGGGLLPPAVELPSDAGVVVTFTCTAGLTNCCEGEPDTPARGDLVGPTDVSSYQGISGLTHDSNGMFLTGVFTGPDEPQDPAPEPLDFTEDCASSCAFESLAPELGQTFFIGSGGPAMYIAPTGATRLFLGFVDGYLYRGQPGWYDNNRGQLSVSVGFGSR